MSDVEQLYTRIGEVEKRIAQFGDQHGDVVQRLNDGLSAVKSSFANKQAEIEQKQDLIDGVSYENEQLRGMLHRLLLAIEGRYSDNLTDTLRDLETKVGALFEVARANDGPADTGAATRSLSGPATRTDETGEEQTDDSQGLAQQENIPGEGEAKWLRDIMHRARALTAELPDPEQTTAPGEGAGQRPGQA